MSTKDKKYAEIPIIAHESEKPGFTFEEIGSGKIYASNKPSKIDTPVVVHDSEKPCLVFEEINSVVVPNFVE